MKFTELNSAMQCAGLPLEIPDQPGVQGIPSAPYIKEPVRTVLYVNIQQHTRSRTEEHALIPLISYHDGEPHI